MGVPNKLAVGGLLLLAVSGCSKPWSSNSINLEPVENAPVQVVNITMRHSVTAVLGAAPVKLTSSTPVNAIGVQYEAKATGPAEEHSAVDARLVCRVGEHTIATPLAHDASNTLHSASVGSLVSGSTTLLPSVFQDAIPTVCEAEFFYAVQPPIDVATGKAEGAKQVPLGRVCLADQTVRVGACSDSELPRPVPTGQIDVAAVEGSIGTLGESGKYGVRIAALVTAGTDAPERWQVGAKAHCATSDGEKDISLPLLMLGRSLRPGESITQGSATSEQAALSTKPERCTVTFFVGIGDEREELESFCLSESAAEAGACSA